MNISKQVFEQINYPHLKINFIDNPKLKNLWQNKRITQKRLLLQEIQQYTNVTDENTYIYLETDGNSKEQQNVIGLPYVFCDSHKVGGTYPQLRNIFVFNQNLSELLIQQIFRCMNSTNIDEDRNIYIYDIQQIIEIIQYFQRLFNSQQSLKEYKSVLPNCISIIGADQQIIDYINHQDFKLSCVTSANEKYIINKIDEKFNSLLSLKISKENKKIQEVQRAVQNLVNDLREVAKTEKVSPFILLIDRVCSYITLCCYTKDKQQCFNMNFNDYSLLQMYKLLNVNEINKLKEIVNSMYKINIVDDDFEFKIKWLCKVFDSQNNSQLIYNYYNKLQLYIATENKIIVYEKFMQQICTSTMYERKHNAEILTPITVCQEMISKGAEYIECLQKKLEELPAIIEPCCGKGAFCVCMYEKLRELGYTEKQILEEILYINDINTFNTFIVQLILNPMQQHKMNVWNEDAVNGIDYSDFDLVITNPPYTRMKQNGYNQDGAQKIFDKIIIQAFAAKHQIMLIPKMWTFQLSLKEFKYQYLQHIIEIIEKGPSQQIFNNNCGNIQIIISEHEKHSVEIKETKSILDQYKYIDGRHFIAEKVQADKSIYQVEEFENSLPCFVSTKINKNCITYVDKEVCKNLQDLKYYYVVFYVKYGQPYTEYTKFKICKPGEIFNSSYGALQCDTEEQAKKLLNYLLIDAQQFIKQRQTSSMNKSVLQMIPQIEE